MFIVTALKTGEMIECKTKAEAEALIRTYVSFVNARISMGIAKGKRDSKRNYTITEA